MASANKFNVVVEHLMSKVHDLLGTGGSDADSCKVALTNTAPVATNSVFADITEIGAGNGYTAGGELVQNVGSRTTGTFTLVGTKVVWTAASGTIGPFQYVVLYNDTPTSPADPLLLWWDYGSALTLNDGETFSVKWNNSDTSGNILTLT